MAYVPTTDDHLSGAACATAIPSLCAAADSVPGSRGDAKPGAPQSKHGGDVSIRVHTPDGADLTPALSGTTAGGDGELPYGTRVYAEERHVVDINVGFPKGTQLRQRGVAEGVTIKTGYRTAQP